MNSRERLLTAIAHKEPDRVPLDLGSAQACKFTKGFYIKLLDYFGFDDEKRELEVCHKTSQLVYASDKVMDLLKCDVRNARVHYQKDFISPYLDSWEDERYSYFTNEFGTTYKMPLKDGLYYDISDVLLKNSENEETDDEFVWPKPDKIVPGSRSELEAYREKGFATTTCQLYGNGFLQTGPLLFNYDKWLMMLVAEPARCEAFIQKLFEKKLEWYDNLFEEYGGLLDVVTENDDMGTQISTFCSPAILRELVFPYHKRLVDYIKKSQPGIKNTLHCCGSCYTVIPDIIECGYDCLNPVQIAAANMEPAKLKAAFGKDITFWGGGINTQSTLPYGTPDQVREETKRNIETFAPGGGYVFSTIHTVQADVPVENFIAMWETFQDNCKY